MAQASKKRYRRLMAALILLTAIGLFAAISTGSYFSASAKPGQRTIELPGETIIIRGSQETGFVIVAGPKFPLTATEYAAYKQRRLGFLSQLAAGQQAEAVVTPTRAMSLDEYLGFSSKYELQILAFKFHSNKRNFGEVTIRPSGGPLDTEISLAEAEESLRKIHGPDFILVYRIYGIKVLASAQVLMRIQTDPGIELVDVGPLDIIAEYSKLATKLRVQIEYLYEYLHADELNALP